MDHQGSASSENGAATDHGREAAGRTPHPWESHYPAHVRWDQPVPRYILPHLLDTAAARWAGKPAIDYRGRKITFSQLAETVDRLAAGLIAQDLGPGRTVALFLPNTPWHTVCFFAVLKAGAKLVHLSPLDAPRELVFKIKDSGADAVVTTDLGGLVPGAIQMLAQGAIPRLLIGDDAHWGGLVTEAPAEDPKIRRLADLLTARAPAEWPVVKPEDIALLQYTGGTTGMPKGAMLSHANMVAATHSYLGWRDETLSPSGDNRVIGVLPMFHVYALGVVLLLNIVDGNEILLRPRFDVKATLDDIQTLRATSFPAVPTMLIALLSDPDAETTDFSSINMVGSGGAPLPQDVELRAERLFGQKLRTGWGMTETAAIGTRVPPNVITTPGLIGVPLPNLEMRVVALGDPTVQMPIGEVGEIAVRGPNLFGGYWNQPALSAECFADGFFLTGDIGKMDETGLFTLVDRKKRMIISGGFNVYPTMIENSIYEHPDVEEVIVIGIPDGYRGEAAKAFIKLRDGAEPMTLETLRGFLADKIGRHEIPTALELRDSLPKSPVGKLLANKLTEEERAKSA